MKDSGVEWLGEVPEHWVQRRLKYLLRECDARAVVGSGEWAVSDVSRTMREV